MPDDTAPEAAHSDSSTADNRPNVIDFESVLDEQIAAEEEDGSHTEFDPRVFHPSSVGYSEWLIMVKKLGLSDTSDLRGTFKMGDLVHEYTQKALVQAVEHIDGWDDIETPVEFDEDGLTFVGHADVYDPEADIVYDIKSRGSWYNFDPPVDRHIDQLHCYMRGLDAQYGQVIYVSKKDMEVRTWPEGAPFTFDEARWDEIKARCKRVRDAIYDEGIPQSEAEIPFDRPDNYFAESTELDFSGVNGGGA
ncbi:hypothetical protein PN419_00585 [Halorubrum ezzemoulense]|uniref:hypothetical protein n=1 Tax=Halorubrum ezzemoulense TaxID=337243 RepID=UPI00232B9637|nr:hypothetical protein [Halorubrum ezzemoulense]MDB9247504.1 hypothetical protein [Halorubrum ezzemoulense]MDB9258587.1 hypothetical protein [Halorubrum ezzemoulense]MDB9264554.1 hypothetical protein [Halorubrum ezzemoulense]MDB9268948.1 hypothetical protein [Halorubrum ezzemoulense]MDB9271522.1 hypothetical protein [Halorubrum ezzemoulense]